MKTDELERLTSLLGINSTKSKLASMAKDVDRVSEVDRDSLGRGSPVHHPHQPLAPTEKGFFSCGNFLAPDGGVLGEGPEPRGRAENSLSIFDKEAKATLTGTCSSRAQARRGWGRGREVGALLAAAWVEGGPAGTCS